MVHCPQGNCLQVGPQRDVTTLIWPIIKIFEVQWPPWFDQLQWWITGDVSVHWFAKLVIMISSSSNAASCKPACFACKCRVHFYWQQNRCSETSCADWEKVALSPWPFLADSVAIWHIGELLNLFHFSWSLSVCPGVSGSPNLLAISDLTFGRFTKSCSIFESVSRSVRLHKSVEHQIFLEIELNFQGSPAHQFTHSRRGVLQAELECSYSNWRRAKPRLWWTYSKATPAASTRATLTVCFSFLLHI